MVLVVVSLVTLVDLCDAALFQSSRWAVNFCINHTFGTVQANSKRRWLVHLQTRLLLDNTHLNTQHCRNWLTNIC